MFSTASFQFAPTSNRRNPWFPAGCRRASYPSPPRRRRRSASGAAMGLERGRVPRQVHEHEVEPHRGAHFAESVPAAVESFRVVPPRPADVGSSREAAFEIVGPGVVGTADRPPHPARLAHQLVTPVRAHVVEYAHRSVTGPGQQGAARREAAWGADSPGRGTSRPCPRHVPGGVRRSALAPSRKKARLV